MSIVRPFRAWRPRPDMAEKDNDADDQIVSHVHIKRLGEMVMPVEIMFTFQDGETELLEWDGAASLKVFEFTRDVDIEKVEIDPYHKILLDTNPNNNSKYKESESFLAFRWGATWLFWLQDLLEMVAIFS